jgi:chloramphenicol 3-O-phosphotransferase
MLLQQRHRAVQATVEVQDELLSQVNNLTLSLGLNSSDSTATAAVAAAAPTVPAAPSGADSTPPGGSTCQPSTSQQHLQQQLQQQQQAAQQQRQYMEEAHVLLERYQSYVTQVAKLLTHHALQPPGNSAAAPGARVVPCALPGTDTVDGTGFPPWPLTMKETLVLYRLGRYASAPQPQQVILGGSSDGGNSSGAAAAVATDDLRLLNVQTGRHEKIPSTLAELWQKAAADVSIRPHQVLQLEAGWQVVRAAIEQLNKEREQLLERLRIAAGQLGGIAMGGQPTSRAAAAAAAADGVVGDHSAGCSTKLWLSEGALALAEYDALADGVEATLVRGRAINVMTSWSMLLIFDNEQVARMMVACYPYFPLIRGVVGCLLNKPELLVHSA